MEPSIDTSTQSAHARAQPRSALLLTAPFLIALLLLLGLSIAGIESLSAARAYVGGESNWSKAQKRAVSHLLRYASERDAADYRQFHANIDVTLGDRQARQELDRPQPDVARIRAGFARGGIHPHDVPRMIRLYRYGRDWQPITQAIDIWRRADGEIDRLLTLASAIDAQVTRRQPVDPQQLATVRALDVRFNALEEQFSLSLGDATRKAENVLNVALIVGTLLLAGFGFGLTRRIVQTQARQQQALAASEQRYRVFFQSSIDPVFLLHDTGEIIDVNPAACEAFGYSRNELIGMHRSRLIDVTQENTRKATQARIEHGRYRGNIEYRRKDGSHFIGDASLAQFTDADGEIRYSVVIRDITEQLRQEEEIRQLNTRLEERVSARTAELEQANRELEAFCHSIAHDLTTPLRAVNGYSALLAEEYGDRLDAEAHHYLQRTREASLRMSRLIDALLGLARHARHPLQRASVDLSQLALELMAQLQQEQPQRDVIVDIQPDLRLQADPVLIHELLRQLLTNAWKFSREATPARISVGRDDSQPTPVYFVRDNGIGFDMKFGNKLFRVFSRLHSSGQHEGTGMGLAVVATIVDRHGGKVWAESAEGQGATFYFTLNETPAQPATLSAQAAPDVAHSQ